MRLTFVCFWLGVLRLSFELFRLTKISPSGSVEGTLDRSVAEPLIAVGWMMLSTGFDSGGGLCDRGRHGLKENGDN